MISPLFYLFTLLLIVSITHGFNYDINLTRCATEELACFVRESCLEGAAATKSPKKLINYKQEVLSEGCDVIVQIKAFTDSKIQVMMQIISKTGDLKPSSGIELHQNKLKFGCYPDKFETTPASLVTGEQVITERFGDRQNFTEQLMFCSFTITIKISMHTFFAQREYDPKHVQLTYKTTEAEEMLEEDGFGGDFWMKAAVRCNPDDVITDDSTLDGLLLRKVDSASSLEITCNTNEELIIREESKAMKSIRRLGCNSRQYKYPQGEDEFGGIVEFQTKFRLHCAKKFCSMCRDLGFKECREKGCIAPLTSVDNCKSVSCPSNKWRLDDGSVIDSTVQCNQSTVPGQERTAGWFMTIDSKLTEITEGSCSTEFDCITYSNLNFTCEKEGCVEASKTFAGLKINCSKGHILHFGDHKAPSIVCNSSDGLYYSGKGEFAPRGSHVYCEVRPVRSDDLVGFIILGSCWTLLIVITVAAGILIPRKIDALEEGISNRSKRTTRVSVTSQSTMRN